MEKIVSIRCRRHKKRFNVPISWLETSRWLCPHCYEMLSGVDREKYSPKGSETPEIREAEAWKSTMYPSKHTSDRYGRWAKKSYREKDVRLDSLIGNFLDKKNSKVIPNEDEIQYNKIWSDAEIDSNLRRFLSEPKSVRKMIETKCLYTKGYDKEIERLKPKYNVHCLKCGQDYPCFSFWFKTSNVLCPECASDMTREQIETFNSVHRDGIRPTEIKKVPEEESESESVMTGYRCSNHFITHASTKELIEAVNQGRLSKARARIELRRRMKSDYFNDLPETEEVQFGRM